MSTDNTNRVGFLGAARSIIVDMAGNITPNLVHLPAALSPMGALVAPIAPKTRFTPDALGRR